MERELKNNLAATGLEIKKKDLPGIFGELKRYFYENDFLLFHITIDYPPVISASFGNISRLDINKHDFSFEGKPFLSFFNSLYAEKIEKEILYLRKNDISSTKLECKFQIVNSEFIWAELTIQCKTNRNKKLTGFVVIINDISRKKEAEIAFVARYNFVQRILDFLPNPVYYKNTKGEFLGINMAYEKLLNLSRNQVIGKTISQLFPHKMIDDYHYYDEEVTRTKKIQIRDEKISYADGSIHDVIISIAPFVNPNLSIGGLVGVINDVTQQKKIETALKISEYHYRQLISFLPEIVIVYANDKILFANDIVHQKLGYKSDELISKNVLMLVDKNYHGIVAENIKRRKAGETVQDYKIKLIIKNGGNLSVIVRGSPIDYNGQTAFMVVLVDITEQEKIEMQIRKSEMQFRTLWENSFDGMRLLNADGITILVNNAFCKIFEKSREELEEKPFYIIYKGELQQNIYNQFVSRMKDNKIEPHLKRKIELWNGKPVWLELTNSIVSLENYPSLVLSVVRDITEKVEIEKQLSLSQKMESVGVLAAGIAHEINTPMQYIGDNTSFLKDSLVNLTKYCKKVEEICLKIEDKSFLREAQNQLQIIKSELDVEFLLDEIPQAIEQTQTGISKVNKIVSALKDFAHPSSKEKSLSDLNHGIEVTITISKNQWKYVADLDTDLSPDLPLVNCILDEINQVILNMIINAAHAIQEKLGNEPFEKGNIKIQTRPVDNFVEIKISDNGNGITSENISKIFDPFFTTKEVGKGTGQGLAIAHDIIVKKHGGTINLESEYGSGTTFIIKLPIS